MSCYLSAVVGRLRWSGGWWWQGGWGSESKQRDLNASPAAASSYPPLWGRPVARSESRARISSLPVAPRRPRRHNQALHCSSRPTSQTYQPHQESWSPPRRLPKPSTPPASTSQPDPPFNHPFNPRANRPHLFLFNPISLQPPRCLTPPVSIEFSTLPSQSPKPSPKIRMGDPLDPTGTY